MNRTRVVILGLALGVVVLMSYFGGGKDYFNRPIMGMLIGATGEYTCIPNCGYCSPSEEWTEDCDNPECTNLLGTCSGHNEDCHPPEGEYCTSTKCTVFCGNFIDSWGIDVSQEEVATLSGWTPKGVSMRGLVEAGERLGLEMVGVKLGINDLKKVNKPFIAHILPRHLVVVEDADDERVYIVDPAVGRMSLSIEEFSKRWKGYSLVVVRKYTGRGKTY